MYDEIRVFIGLSLDSNIFCLEVADLAYEFSLEQFPCLGDMIAGWIDFETAQDF